MFIVKRIQNYCNDRNNLLYDKNVHTYCQMTQKTFMKDSALLKCVLWLQVT